MAERYTFEVDLNSVAAETKLRELIRLMEDLQETTTRRGDTGSQRAVASEYTKLTAKLTEYSSALDIVRQKLAAIEKLKAGASSVSQGVGKQLNLPDNLGKVETVRGGGGLIKKNVSELIGQEQQLLQVQDVLIASVVQFGDKARAAYDGASESARHFQEITNKVYDATSNNSGVRALKGQLGGINEEINRLIERKAELNIVPLRNLGARGEERVARTLEVRDAKVKSINKEILALKERQKVETGNQLEIELELLKADERRASAIRNAQESQVRKDAVKDLTGASEEESRIEERINVLRTLRKAVQDGIKNTDLSVLGPEYANQISQLTALNKLIIKHAGDEAKVKGFKQQQLDILEKIVQLESAAAKKDFRSASPAETAANLPRLERTIFGAFDDFSKRFVTTLQFAISGALIFGVQKFFREFLKTAIEVERTFADISTAFEFDITAKRGTKEFDREIRNIRLNVLSLADEFNTLPTEANKSAFVMIARFTDVGNAMKALRSQMLATKISTISQDETLRALTAVAEAVSAQTLATSDSISLQGRLLERETASAEAYARALDLAAFSQQRFGVEVEDALEGMARAAPTLTQMGFSIEEVNALVTAVSQSLGQTGQQVAERLNRSIGQLSAAEIKDQLLKLAELSDNFFLTEGDFVSGAQAWRQIVGQFEALQNVEPKVAEQILQIIGQRRELEAVAAALATTGKQREIVDLSDEAIGAAERRYESLRNTFEEIIASIGGGFEELAQNFERSTALEPFKNLLKLVDGFLTAVNSVLKAFESWPLWLRKSITYATTLLATLRALAAAQVALQVLGSSGAGGNAGRITAGGQLGLSLGALFHGGIGSSLDVGTQQKVPRSLSLKNFGTSIKDVGTSTAGALKQLRAVPIVWIAIGAAVINTVSSLRSSAHAVVGLSKTLKDTAREVSREARDLGLSKNEEDQLFAERQLEELIATSGSKLTGLAAGFAGLFPSIYAAFSDDFDKALYEEAKRLGITREELLDQILPQGRPGEAPSAIELRRGNLDVLTGDSREVERAAVVGSREWWEQQIENARTNFYEAGTRALNDDIAEFDFRNLTPEQQIEIDVADRNFYDATVRNPDVTPEDIFRATQARKDAYEDADLALLEGTEGAIADLQAGIERIKSRFSSGEISQSQRERGLAEFGIKLPGLLSQAQSGEDREKVREAGRDLSRAIIEAITDRISLARDVTGFIKSDSKRLLELYNLANQEANELFNRGASDLEIAKAFFARQEALDAYIQHERETARAFAVYNVDGRDSFGRLGVELANLRQELKQMAALGQSVKDLSYVQLLSSIRDAEDAVEDAAIELAIANSRLGTDLSNPLEQAAIDLEEIALKLSVKGLGSTEKSLLLLERAGAELAHESAFFNDRLFELEFASKTGKLGTSGYVSALKQLLAEVDLTTSQGKQIFLQIQGVIDGLTGDLANLQFNIPTDIILPTLFEVRRAVEADALGVNYQDNRQQNITLNVDGTSSAAAITSEILNALGDSFAVQQTLYAPGGSSYSGTRF